MPCAAAAKLMAPVWVTIEPILIGSPSATTPAGGTGAVSVGACATGPALARVPDVPGTAAVPARRYSLANSAGICLGAGFAFDLVRPGLALYGGIPRDEAIGHIAQVAFPQAEIVQRRTIRAGETIGYGAAWTAAADTEAAIVNIGYADGYLRCFAGKGSATANGNPLPLIGRVSMDLIALDASAAPELREGDWVALDYDLPLASEVSGLSQYELLTGLSDRLERRWS